MLRNYPCSRCKKSLMADEPDATSVAINEYRSVGHAVDMVRKDYNLCGPCWRALQAFVRGEEPPVEPEKDERPSVRFEIHRNRGIFGSTGR